MSGLSKWGKIVVDRNYSERGGMYVNGKWALTALGAGAAYLMRNKNARDKLMRQVESFTGMSMGNKKNSSSS